MSETNDWIILGVQKTPSKVKVTKSKEAEAETELTAEERSSR